MKQWIEKKGLPARDLLYTTPRGGQVKILSSCWAGRVEVEVIVPIPGGSPKGARGHMPLSALPGLAEQIEAADRLLDAEFAAKYPGIADTWPVSDPEGEQK